MMNQYCKISQNDDCRSLGWISHDVSITRSHMTSQLTKHESVTLDDRSWHETKFYKLDMM